MHDAPLTMLDLDADPNLRRLFLVARARVVVGFLVAGVALWLARPSWNVLGWGASIAFAGESLRVWAAGHLRKGQEVTRSGPYRYVRHPLYVGSFAIGFGFAVAAGHPLVAVLVVAYLAVTLYAAIRLEEATLREAFGTEFDLVLAWRRDPVRSPIQHRPDGDKWRTQGVVRFRCGCWGSRTQSVAVLSVTAHPG